MKCETCNGTGYRPKKPNCNCSWGFECIMNECNKPIKCYRCDGWGFTGFKPSELASLLRVVANQNHLDKDLKKECLIWVKRITNNYKRT